ncbi:hypothetical protein ASPZODRAFT_43945, partial [Penicilliopsis zonata CBS 506.65]
IQYRKKSLLIHPDKTKNPAAPDAFDRLKKAQTTLMDEKAREQLDESIADARRLLIREHKYTLDSPELKTEEFKKEWRQKTVQVLMEEEARRRRQIKAKMQEEGREQRKEEEELEARKRKRDQDKAWEDTREERIESWRDWKKGVKKSDDKKKKKKTKAVTHDSSGIHSLFPLIFLIRNPPVMTANTAPDRQADDRPTIEQQPQPEPFSEEATQKVESRTLRNSADWTGTTEATVAPPATLAEVVASLHHRVHAFLAEDHPADSLLAHVQKQTRISLDVVASALLRYRLSELSLSYNGGKDCLVLLILFLAGLHPLSSHSSSSSSSSSSSNNNNNNDNNTNDDKSITSIPAIYALPPDPFPAVEEFVLASSQSYHLDVTRYTTDPPRTTLRSSFENYLARNPSIRAIFVGTRRTDPHGASLTHFDRTDHGWPDFVRIHPVIDWHYAEIWAFIRHLRVDYCPLYDQGYTSLGGTTDTDPNPRLRLNHDRYRPAYDLTEDLEERLGRN